MRPLETRNAQPTVRTFAPELWAEVDAFMALHSGTYLFAARDQRSLGGVRRHFGKAQAFRDKASASLDALVAEQAEMDRVGYSADYIGNETAQEVEAAIAELYSCIDCTAKVVHAIYGKDSRGFRNSTSFLFTTSERITGAFPEALKREFSAASWEKPLRHLRDELVHCGTGHCDLAQGSVPTIRYLHLGIRQGAGRVLEIFDVIAWLNEQTDRINAFLGAVFRFLRGTLKPAPVHTMCGVRGGRALIRALDPSERAITFDSGTCLAVTWIEDPELPTCPFITDCGAYRRARPNTNPAAVLASKRHPEPWVPAAQGD